MSSSYTFLFISPIWCNSWTLFSPQGLAISSAWNISYWLFLINQVSAQKPFPERTCQIMVAYFKKVYTLLSTSICLAHSLLCIYSIACTPVYGYFYFLFPASEECKFYISFYSVLFPQTPEIYLEYVCARVSHSVVSDSTTPCSPPGSFIHGILQARILEWVSISFSNKNIVGAK